MRFIDLVFKNVLRRKLRSCFTATGIAIGVAAVTALLNFSLGFERSACEVYEGRDVDLVIVRAGVTERMTSSLKEELAQRILTLPGVSAVNPSLTDLVSLGEESLVGVTVHGWPVESFALKRLSIVAGRTLKTKDHETVLLGQGLAACLRKQAGDKIRIESHDFRVVGLFQGTNPLEDATAIVLLPELQRLMDRPGLVTEFQILMDPHLADRSAAADQLRPTIAALRDDHNQFLGLAAIPTQQFVSGSTEIRLAHALAWTSSLLAVLIGGVGMFNTMTMTVLERTQEIGVLRAIGWRKGRIWLMIFCESELLSFAGALLGILAGIGITLLLSYAPVVRGLIRTDISPPVLVWGLTLALLIGFLGGIYPAIRGSRFDPVEAMRHE
jgi:putative ABC transport system permease protein